MSAKTVAPVLTRRVLRFGISGLLATGLHVLIAVTLIRSVLLPPSIANGAAFAMATIFSYLINTMWSFGRPLHGRNLLRFCAVSCIGLILAMIISGAAQHFGLHYMLGIFFVVLTVPPVTFLLHTFWTYR
jgi:putative flippase GtrA